MFGRKHSEETLAKMRKSAKERVAKGIAVPSPGYGSKHHNWKGGVALYESVHNWVANRLGRPNLCSKCGVSNDTRFEWSNISGEYRYDIDDWERLCISCHRDKDAKNPLRPEKIFPNQRQKRW